MCSLKVLPKKSGNMKNEKTAIEEEINDRIAQGEVQGRDVEYWKVLDRITIVRIKGRQAKVHTLEHTTPAWMLMRSTGRAV